MRSREYNGLAEELILPCLEESKDEEEVVNVPILFPSPNFVSSVSFRKTDTMEGDDEEDVLCAICLSGYGTLLILS